MYQFVVMYFYGNQMENTIPFFGAKLCTMNFKFSLLIAVQFHGTYFGGSGNCIFYYRVI